MKNDWKNRFLAGSFKSAILLASMLLANGATASAPFAANGKTLPLN
jgi:hypothetical protein